MLTVSWELALRADGYANGTVKAYQNAVRSLADWLAEQHTEVEPTKLDRRHIRGWLVAPRQGHASNTARGWFAGVRHFCRWLEAEGEADCGPCSAAPLGEVTGQVGQPSGFPEPLGPDVSACHRVTQERSAAVCSGC